MTHWPTARGRPDARQPLPAGSRLSWAVIAINGEPWPGEPPRYDPSADVPDTGNKAGDTAEMGHG